MVREGYEPVLKKKRWCLLKRPQNLTDQTRAVIDHAQQIRSASLLAKVTSAWARISDRMAASTECGLTRWSIRQRLRSTRMCSC